MNRFIDSQPLLLHRYRILPPLYPSFIPPASSVSSSSAPNSFSHFEITCAGGHLLPPSLSFSPLSLPPPPSFPPSFSFPSLLSAILLSLSPPLLSSLSLPPLARNKARFSGLLLIEAWKRYIVYAPTRTCMRSHARHVCVIPTNW